MTSLFPGATFTVPLLNGLPGLSISIDPPSPINSLLHLSMRVERLRAPKNALQHRLKHDTALVTTRVWRNSPLFVLTTSESVTRSTLLGKSLPRMPTLTFIITRPTQLNRVPTLASTLYIPPLPIITLPGYPTRVLLLAMSATVPVIVSVVISASTDVPPGPTLGPTTSATKTFALDGDI